MSIVDKIDAISEEPISVAAKIAASRASILTEKLDHALRVAEIIHRNNRVPPYDARWELEIENRVSRLELKQVARQVQIWI